MTVATRSVPRVVLGVVTGLCLTVLSSDPAAAHTRTEETTNVDSRLISAPDVGGVSWTVHTGGLALEVENRSPSALVVHGYDGEPYLRIGPEGVERNRRSPATYLNGERFADVAMPPDADPTAPPEWVQLGSEPRYVWHDHRTHWMSTQPPPFVDAGPVSRAVMEMRLVGVIGTAGDDGGVFHEWAIPVTIDGVRHEVHGEMAWQDPPSPLPWLALAVVLVAPALLGLRRSGIAGMVRPAALVVGAVATVNTIHLVDDLVAWPSEPLDELFGLLHTTSFLAAGIGAAVWAWRVPSGRVLALGIGSGAVLYHQGLVHLPMLFASQFPTVWPDPLVRLTVALGVVQALVVTVIVIRCRTRNQAPARELDL